jgi:hypothetical protein
MEGSMHFIFAFTALASALAAWLYHRESRRL